MSAGAALAAASAFVAVHAVWEGLGAIDLTAAAARWRRIVAPWHSAAGGRPIEHGAERHRFVALVAAAFAGAGALVAGAAGALLAAVVAPAALGAALRARRERRRARLRDGAPAVARAVGDALAAGMSIRGAFQSIGDEALDDVVADEVRTVGAALALGEPTDVVLDALRARADCAAWDTIVAAVLLQREAGGDLAGLLRALAADLEAGRRAAADARTLVAQARFTARLVAGLPVGAVVLGELVSPGLLAGILGHPLSMLLAGCAVLLEAVGLILVRRIAGVGSIA